MNLTVNFPKIFSGIRIVLLAHVFTSRAAAESNGGVSAFKTFSDFSLMGDF